MPELLTATASFRPSGFRLAEPSQAGGKGAGLLRLPPAWYPPTLILSPELHALFREGKLLSSFLEADPKAEEFERAVTTLAATSPTKQLLLRSSAAKEGMAERGKFDSTVVGASLKALELAAMDRWREVVEKDVQLGFIVEPFLRSNVSGHLSNEHRVSRDSTSWVSDMQVGKEVQSRTWRVTSSAAASGDALACRSVSEIEPCLRSVAKRLSDSPRYHLEWLWDGDRIWIVQADPVPPVLGLPPGDTWQLAVGVKIDVDSFRVWDALVPEKLEGLGEWSKVAALTEFSRANLPVAHIWRLAEPTVITALADGSEVPGLRSDLEAMCLGHVVVRTDVRSDTEPMRPRTETESDPVVVEAFLRKTSAVLLAEGIAARDISFLAHRYLRARACAWTLAKPDEPYVEVDSMWGTPDGLSWLPHDSSWVNTDTLEVRRSIEGKTSYYDVDESGHWVYRETPTEWIWRASMTEDQLRTVAAGAQRLARLAGTPVMTMWFIGMLDGVEAECLPWYQTRNIPPEAGERGQISPASKRISIRTIDDLEMFALTPGTAAAKVLRLEPGAELVRDKGFVKRVIEVALGRNITVELVGSSLAHPYYILREAGVTVSCVGQFEQPQLRFNKLVRDNIVEQIESNGEAVVSYRTSGSELTKLLRLKAVEEAMELLRAETLDDTIGEMADVEEVLLALQKALGIRRDDLRLRQKEKRGKRGGFKDGTVLISTGRRTRNEDDQLDGPFEDLAEDRGWQVQQRAGAVLVSNLPPLAGERRTYIVKLGNKQIRVEYRASDIELRVLDEATDLGPGEIALFDP